MKFRDGMVWAKTKKDWYEGEPTVPDCSKWDMVAVQNLRRHVK